MPNLDNSPLCYVFSENTLSLATIDWKKDLLEEDETLEEQLSIALAALPWLLEYMAQFGPIFMFTSDDLTNQLEKWKEIQIQSFPHQQLRIEKSCELINHFFNSDTVRITHKMMVDTQ